MNRKLNLSHSKTALWIAVALFIQPKLILAQEEQPADSETTKEEIEHIQVTTEFRSQGLQDIAATVKAISGEDLRKQGINNFTDLSNAFPQLNIGNREGNVEVFIRGIGDDNNTELSEPRSAILYDGVYLSRPRGLGSFFYDISTVEVNVGPQGTLRGRNATGGSLNIITTKPVLGELSGYADLGIGNFNQREFQGALNIPVNDESALRVAAYTLSHDSKIESLEPRGLNIRESREVDDKALRASYAWYPNENLTVNLSADYLEGDGTGYGGLDYFSFFQNQANGNIPQQKIRDLDNPYINATQGGQPSERQRIWGTRATISYDFERHTVEYISAYRDVDYLFKRNFSEAYFAGFEEHVVANSNLPPLFVGGSEDAFYNNFGTIQFDQDFSSMSHELRVMANDDQRFRWTAGLFYFKETGESYFNTAADREFVFAGVEFAFPEVERENFAVFTDATYDLTEKTRFTAGLRYTDESLAREGFGATYLFLFPTDTSGAAPDTFNFSCCAPHRFGTPGFQFAGRERTTFVNDVDITTAEGRIALFLSGIGQFGQDDNLDEQLQLLLTEGSTQSGFGLDGREISNIIPNSASRSDTFVNWRLRLEHDLTDDNLVYGSISTGTNSGGFNDTFRNLDGSLIAPEFGKEEVTVFELGSKNVFEIKNYPSILNAAAFFYKYDDQQFTVLAPLPAIDTPDDTVDSPVTLVSLRQNVGDSEILGFDIDYTQYLPSDLKIRLNLQYLDTEFVSASQPLIDTRFDATENNIDLPSVPFGIVGNQLPKASKWQGSLSVSQAIENDLGTFYWILSVGFRSEYYLTIFNGNGELPVGSPELFPGVTDPEELESLIELYNTSALGNAGAATDIVDGYVRYDFGAGFEPAGYENIRFEIYGKNLSDEVYSQTSLNSPGLNLRFLNDPRTYGARVRVSF